MSRAWPVVLARDLATVSSGKSGKIRARALARLADSAHATAIESELAPTDAFDDPWLAYAAARRRLARDEQGPAVAHLVRAQALLPRAEHALIARVAFTLGGLQVTSGELRAASLTLDWAEGFLGRRGASAPDVAHLRALVFEARGDRAGALAAYRAALRRRGDALTPLSAVLAMRNLGEALVHEDPAEARSLHGHALAQLEAHELDPAIRPGLTNALGYALLCLGELAAAREVLSRAERDAIAERRTRIVLYARFNRAILDELEGEVERARGTLDDVVRDAGTASLDDVAAWARIRLAWLDVRGGRPTTPAVRGEAYGDALLALRAIGAVREERDEEARTLLVDAARRTGGRGDSLGRFALLLWLALVEERDGRRLAARRAARAACALGLEHGYALSPNWWTAELANAAAHLAPRDQVEYASGLHRPPDVAATSAGSRVELARDATIRINGAALAPERWRVGRTGSRVLRRLLAALLAAHPVGLARDELADLLWPESEGDRAVRNLYAASDDLRRLLADVPGVRLVAEEGRYTIVIGSNVTLA